ncbi:hypothetical protein MEO93_30135, partial [Dolichospermum sp. ST_sed3]|nr:hypothetical protein [Dolichospermum sp. ST_sed3]
VILKLKATQIKVLNVQEGSVIVTLLMPEKGAKLLLSMYLSRQDVISKLQIQKVEVHHGDSEIHIEENNVLSQKTKSKLDRPIIDVVLLTVLPEEYQAFNSLITDLKKWRGRREVPNILAWQVGSIPCLNGLAPYKIALGMIGRAGNVNSALAVREAIDQWSPRYIFFVGIAGGLKKLNKGDVVIADVIYGYEYGKLESVFIPRMDWSYRTDQGLLTGAMAYSSSADWRKRISLIPPKPCQTDISIGIIASGD